MSYLPFLLLWQNTLTERLRAERVRSGWEFRQISKSLLDRKAWGLVAGVAGSGGELTTARPSPSDWLPPARPLLLRVQQPSQTASPAQDRVFTLMSLWETFHNTLKPQYKSMSSLDVGHVIYHMVVARPGQRGSSLDNSGMSTELEHLPF